MPKGFTTTSALTKDLLTTIATAGCLIVVATISPHFFAKFLYVYFKEKNREMAWKRAARLRELEKKKVVSFTEMPDGAIKIELTHRGKKLLRQYKLEELKIDTSKPWDKKWRLISYDIPEYKKNARRALSTKFRKLKLFQLQKSLWVSAYPCLEEMEFICAVFDINLNHHIFYLEVPKVPKEEKIKRWFGI